jgi:acid phosphatase
MPSAPAVQSDSATDAALPTDVSLDAVLWMQRSVEYDAVTSMAYATATRMLDVALADPGWTAAPAEQGETRGKKPAVILDVDETVLDNSPYAAWLMQTHRDFESDTFNAWCEAAQAESIPGALAFTRHAADKGVDVYFVSNRDAPAHAGTLANLQERGFPVDEAGERLMLRGEQPDWGSDKGTRRAEIAKDHRILLLIGDNLGDFVDGAKADTPTRHAAWEAHADAWGTAWIMLPNPDYGTWEHPVYATKERLDASQQRAKKLSALTAWSGPRGQ